MADQHRNEAMPRALGELRTNFEMVLREVGEPVAAKRRPRLRRPQVIALAISVLVLAIVGASLVVFDGSRTEDAIATIARNAAEQPPVPPSQFAYSDVELRDVVFSMDSMTSKTPKATRYVTRQRSWLSTTRPGLVETTVVRLERVSDDRALPDPASINRVKISRPPVGRVRFIGELRTLAEIKSIAARPNGIQAALDDELKNVKPQDRLTAAWTTLIEPLKSSSPPLPPYVRAALVTALGEIPGVKADDNAVDPRGRDAIALSLQAQGQLDTVMFDRETSELLTETIVVNDARWAKLRGVPVGTEIQSYLLVESGVTPVISSP